MLRGALAAAVTPLRAGGDALDEEAFAPLVEFLVEGGLDGILALGTTGEGVMLSESQRRRAAELFVHNAGGRLAVAVHCGAQTTAETVRLAAHAHDIGANAVAVIAPPYYPFDEDGLLRHLRDAAHACSPLPFYVYEFAARSGYAIPVGVIERLRSDAPNLAGLKVSDSPFDRVRPYLLDGLDVFVGAEPLIVEGLRAGAAGAVSGLATAFPELVAELVGNPGDELQQRVRALRERFQPLPIPAAFKAALAVRGVPVREDVRAPLRTLTERERAEVAELVGYHWPERR
jgi:dihydrodipicolinate synthase/N-acetylneuraminate lyase